MRAFQNGIHAQKQFLHAERFGDVIVAPALETRDGILLHAFRREENNGRLLVTLANVLGQGKAILQGHHHIQDQQVVLAFGIRIPPLLAIGAVIHRVAFGHQVLGQEVSQIGVILTEQ